MAKRQCPKVRLRSGREFIALARQALPATYQAQAGSEQPGGVPAPSPDASGGGPQELGEGRAKGHHVP